MNKENGFSVFKNEHDKDGNVILQTYYDSTGELVELEGGYAATRSTYNLRSNEIERAFYDKNGELSSLNESCKYKFKYDQNKNIIETTSYDCKGNLGGMISEGGHSKYIAKYDYQGNLIEEKLFDARNQLTNHQEQGWAIAKNQYNHNNHLIETILYDSDGGKKKRTIYKYNKNGDVIEQIIYSYKFIFGELIEVPIYKESHEYEYFN